mmetsp:Transcript_113920/g.179327  ORF Transcript_113920/g.179327 Transcript_113920/m.179327 type:complete len:224 (+) Transcript_113920:39-710(+)
MGVLCSKRSPPPHNPAKLGKSIVVISDTHGEHRKIPVPDADILIHAGDFTRFGSEQDAVDFNAWLATLPHRNKIIVEGNHENNAPWKARARDILSNGTFLRNEAVDVDGVRIFGKGFFWNMKSKNPYDDLIPSGTDIIIAHNPAKGYVDGGKGCQESAALCERLHPRLYICGHVHFAKGTQQGSGLCATTLFVNGASVLGDHNAKKEDSQAYEINGSPILLQI